ncbi:MAG TPA: DUF4129 domain-containing protein [Dehalococcoidales bacterium]|nr:DUF4129 domain-containing protein [Dehalococcoidales bacterium]
MNNRIKSVDWLAALLYPAFVVLMETFWVYPWLLWLGTIRGFSQPRPALSLAAVFIIMAAAFLAIRYIIRPGWSMRAAQSVIVGAGLLMILLTIGVEYRAGHAFLSPAWFKYIGGVFGATFSHPSPVIFAAPAAVYLWWRGINLGQSTSYFKSVYNSFVIGIVALVILMALWQFGAVSGTFSHPGANVGLDIIAFFFFGLMAIAVTHFYQMRGAMAKEETGLLSVRRWLPIMIAVIGVMVVIVFFVAGAFSEGFFTSAGQAISLIAGFFGKIIEYIAVPFNFLFVALLWVLRWIVNLLRDKQQPPPQSDNGTPVNPYPNNNPTPLPHWVGIATEWLIVAVIAGAVVFFIARAVSRYRDRRDLEEIEQLDESLLNWDNVNKDLRALLMAMAKRLQRKKARAERTYYDDEKARMMEIREIYRQLLEEAATSGYVRSNHETTLEYELRLNHALERGDDSLEGLTDIYNNVRYGETLPPVEKVEKANGFWQALRALLRGIRGENSG